MMNTNKFKLLLLCMAVVNTVNAQDIWTYFSPDDFAIMQGAELPEAFVKFRQDNNFYYLTGVEMPGAVLIIDGKAKTSLLFVPDKIPGDIKEEARIVAGTASASLYKMDAVRSLTAFTGTLNHYASLGQPFYLMSSPEETTEMTRDRGEALRVSRMNDPWDERMPKEVNFIHKINERYPLVAVKD